MAPFCRRVAELLEQGKSHPEAAKLLEGDYPYSLATSALWVHLKSGAKPHRDLLWLGRIGFLLLGPIRPEGLRRLADWLEADEGLRQLGEPSRRLGVALASGSVLLPMLVLLIYAARQHWPTIFLGGYLIAGLAVQPMGQWICERLQPKLQHVDQARVFTALAALLEAGVEVPASLEQLNELSISRRLQRKLQAVLASLNQGTGLAQAMHQHELADPEAREEIRVAEMEGTLPEAFRRLTHKSRLHARPTPGSSSPSA